MSETKKTKKKETAKPEKNTMKMLLTNSNGTTFKLSGSCTDREIKAICKVIDRTDGQKVEVGK